MNVMIVIIFRVLQCNYFLLIQWHNTVLCANNSREVMKIVLYVTIPSTEYSRHLIDAAEQLKL